MVSYLAKHKRAHRDISIANVYLYGDRGIVSDFEYMKEMSESTRSDRRTVRVGLFGALIPLLQQGQSTWQFVRNLSVVVSGND